MAQEKILNIKKACEIVDQVFLFIKSKIKKGVTEKQIAELIDDFIRKNQAKSAFKLISFGRNTADIHHKPTDKKLETGEPIMLDFGAEVNGFCSDLTRTLFFGKPSPEFAKIYKLVLKAQKSALNFLTKGPTLGKGMRGYDVDAVARGVIKKADYGRYFPHGLGHSLGKKVHDGKRLSPKSKDILWPGDIVTIEPGIYIKGKGGVRIEDDVLIKKETVEILTKSKKELKDIVISL